MMVRIYKMTGKVPAGKAYCLATEYRVKGGFVPKMIWVFETDEPDLDALRGFVDDYFVTVIGTDLYVKEVPQDSLLFEQEAKRLYGTVSVFCESRAE
jgi:hypothetical protein